MSRIKWTQATALLCLFGQLGFCQTAMSVPIGPTAPAAPTSVQTAAPSAAQRSGARPVPINLDLTSTAANITPGRLVNTAPVNINVGGSIKAVTNAAVLTPAQMLAVYQVMSTGTQSIVLGNAGNAVGGSLNIGPRFSNYVSNLVIPQGVTAVSNVANSGGLNLSGNLTNFGSLYAISTNPAVTTASIAASNIYNGQSGLVTTVIPHGGLSGYSNLVNNVDLKVSAANNIVNSGVMSSAGNLTIQAGGTITNSLPSQASALATAGTVPQLIAAQSINLITGAGQIVNTGLIQAQRDVNIGTTSPDFSANSGVDLKINNTGGIITATGTLNQVSGMVEGGTINLREKDYSGSGNIDLTGGDWLSQSLNFNAGQGEFTASVDQLSGKVSGNAGAAHVIASTPVLTLGNTCVTGDPTYVNMGGDIQLVNTDTEAADLAIIASGNIAANGPAKIVDSGHNVWLIAGAAITPVSCPGCQSSGTPLTLPGTATKIGSGYIQVSAIGAGGGNIDLQTFSTLSAGNTVIDTSSATGGGNVYLVALANGVTGGKVLFPTTANVASIKTSGATTYANGSVTIDAGLASAGNSVVVNNITTSGGSGAAGSITINTAQAGFSGGTGCPSCISFDSTGSATGSITSTTPVIADVVLYGPIAAGSGNLTIQSGRVGSSASATIGAYDVNISTISSSNGTISLAGNVTSTHNVVLSADGSGNIDLTSAILSATNSTSLLSGSGSIINSGKLTTANLTLNTSGSVNLYCTSASGMNLASGGATFGDFQVRNTGNITTTTAITSRGQQLLLDTSSGTGSITIGGNLSGGGGGLKQGIQLYAGGGASGVSVLNGCTVSTSNGAYIRISGGSLNLNSSGSLVTDSAGGVIISPNIAGTTISVNGAASGTFLVPYATLSKITTGYLQIGTQGGVPSGTIYQGNSLDVSSLYDFALQTAYAYSGTGSTTTLGSRSFSISCGSAYTASVGSVNGAATSVTVSAGSIVLNSTGTLTLGSGSTLNLTALTAGGTLTQSGSIVTADTMIISSAGSIGALTISASTLTANASAGGVTITNNRATTLALNASSATGGVFSLTSQNGGINTLGAVTSNSNVSLICSGAYPISLGANVSGVAVTLQTSGTGQIASVGTVTGSTSLALTSGSGNIGPLLISTPSLTLNTTGSVTLTNSTAAGLTISSPGSTFASLSVTTDHGLTVSSALKSNSTLLLMTSANSGAISLNSLNALDVTITADGSGAITQSVGSVTGTNSVSLRSGSGAIGSIPTVTPNLTINTTGTATVSNTAGGTMTLSTDGNAGSPFSGLTVSSTNGISVNSEVYATTGTVSLTAGNGSSLNVPSILQGKTVTLTTTLTGAITAPALTATGALTCTTGGGAGDINITANTPALSFTTAGNLTANLTGASATTLSQGGVIAAGIVVTTQGDLKTLTAIQTVSPAGILTISSPAGKNITLGTSVTGGKVTIATTGLGNISQSAAVVTGATSIALSGGDGTIGSISTSTPTMTINSTGTVTVVNGTALVLGVSRANNLSVSSAGNLTASGTISATSLLTLISTAGNIGSINTSTPALSLKTAGTATVVNSGFPLSLSSGGTSFSNISVSNDNSIAVGSAITTGGTATLTTTGNDGSISLGVNNVTATGAAKLIVIGNGGITSAAGILQGSTVTLNSGTGDINLRAIATASGVTLDTAGNATIIHASYALNLSSSSVFQSLTVSNNLGITAATSLNAINGLSLQATAGNGAISFGTNDIKGSAVTLSANGSGTVTGTGTVTGSASVSLSSGSGAIGSPSITTVTPALTVNTTGAATVSNTGAVSLTSGGATFTSLTISNSGSISTTNQIIATNAISLTTSNDGGISLANSLRSLATNITLSANGMGAITQSVGPITAAGTLQITSDSGDIGPLTTQTGTLILNTKGSANVTNGNTLSLSTLGATFGSVGSGGGLSVTNNNNLTVTTPLDSASSLTLALTASGTIFVNKNLTGNAGVNLTTVTGCLVNVLTATTVASSNSPITITTNGLTLNGTAALNAGAGTVILQPVVGNTIGLNGGAGTLQIPGTALANITAGTLQVGNSGSGLLTQAGTINVSGAGAGAYNLNLQTGAGYTATGSTTTLGTKTLSITASGAALMGAISGGNTSLTVVAGSATLQNNIALGVTSTASFSTSAAAGAITQTGGMTLTAQNVSLQTSGSGASTVGSAGTPITVSASVLSVNTISGLANVTNSAGGALALNASSVGGDFTLKTVGTLNINGAANVTGNNALSSSGGSININSPVFATGTNSLTSTSGGVGTISVGANVDGTAVTLSTTGANNITGAGIVTGTGSVTVSSPQGAINLSLATPSITTSQTPGFGGSVVLSDSVALTGNGISTAGTGGFQLTDTAGGIKTNNSITATGGQVRLTSTQAGSPITIGGAISGSGAQVTATAGDISVGAGITTTGTSRLKTSGAGKITGAGLIDTGAVADLQVTTDTGDINLSNLSVSIITVTQNVVGPGSVTLSNYTRSISVNMSTAGAGGFSLTNYAGGGITAPGIPAINSSGPISLVNSGGNIPITISGALNGTNITLTATGSGGISGAGVITGNSVSLTSPSGTINLSNLATPFITTSQTPGGAGKVTLIDSVALVGNGISTAGMNGFSFTDLDPAGIAVTNTITVAGGSLSLISSGSNAPINIVSGISASNIVLTANGTGTISGPGIVMGSTSVSMTSPGGVINLSLSTPNFTTTQTVGGAGSVILTDSQGITGNGASSAGLGGFSLIDTSPGGISLNSAIDASGAAMSISSNATGQIQLTNSNLTAATVALTTTGAGGISGAGSTVTGSTSVSLTSNTGSISLTLATPSFTTTQPVGGAGWVSLTDTQALVSNGACTAGFGFTLIDSAGITITNPINSGGNVTLNSSGASITINAGVTAANPVTLITGAGGNITGSGLVTGSAVLLTCPTGTVNLSLATAGVTITQTNLQPGSVTLTNSLPMSLAASTIGTGGLILTDNNGNITISGNVTANGGGITLTTTGTNEAIGLSFGLTAATITLTATGPIAGIGTVSASSVSASTPDVINIPALQTGYITVASSSAVMLTDSIALTGNGVCSAGAGGFSLVDSAAGGISITNPINSGGPVTLKATIANAPISIGAALKGTTVDLTTSGAGTISGGAIITGTTAVSLTSPSGSINLSGLATPMITIAQTPGQPGSVTLTDSVALTSNGNSIIGTGGLNFTDSADGGISVSNSIDAPNGPISLVNKGTNAPIYLQNSISGSAITLTATGSGSISGPGGVSANSLVSLGSGSGDINLGGITGTDLVLGTTGNITVTHSGPVNVTCGSTTSSFALTNDSNVTIVGALTGINSVAIDSGSGAITPGGSIKATAAGTGLVSLAQSGSITDSLASYISAANISLKSTASAVNLTTAGLNAITSIVLDGSTGVTATGGLLNTSSLTVNSGAGSVTVSSTNAVTLTASSNGTTTLTDSATGGAGVVTLNGSNSTAGDLQITLSGAGESLTVAGPVFASTVILAANNGGITQKSGASITGNSSVSLTAGSGSVTFGDATKAIAGGGTVSVTASNSLTDGGASSISADNISLTSTSSNINFTSTGLTAVSSITLDGSTGVNSTGGLLNTASLTLKGGTGAITVSNTNAISLTASSNGSITITDSATGGAVDLNACNSVGGNVKVSVTGGGESLNVAGPISGSTVVLSAVGALSVSAAITGTNDVQLTAGTINVNDAVTATNSVKFSGGTQIFAAVKATATGTGVVSITESGLLTDTAIGLVNVTADNINLKSSGSKIILFNPLSAVTSVTLDALSDIGTSTVDTGSLTLVSTGGVISADTNATSLSATTSGAGTISISDSATGGKVMLNAASAGSIVQVSLSGANEALSIAGSVSGSSLTLSANGGNIDFAASANAASITVSTTGSGTISQSAGTITATGSANLHSGSGNISVGSLSTPSLLVNTAGDVAITNSTGAGLALSSAGANFKSLSVTTNNSLTTTTTLNSVGVLSLTTTNNGAITLGNNVIAGQINLNAGGSGSITQSLGNLSAGLISLTSGSGSIGALNTVTPSLTLSTTGNVTIGNSGVLSLAQGAGAFNSLVLSNDSNLTTTTALNAGATGSITLTTSGNSDINLGSTVSAAVLSITAGGSGMIQSAGSLSGKTSIALSSTSGAIGPVNTTTPLLSMGTTGNATATNNGAVSFSATSTFNNLTLFCNNSISLQTAVQASGALSLKSTANNGGVNLGINAVKADSISITANGSGAIQSGSTLTGITTMSLSSDSGTIGPVNTVTPALTLNTKGAATVSNVGVLSLSSGGATFASLSVTNDTDMTVKSTFSAGNSITLNSSDGSININAALTSPNSVTLSAAKGSVTIGAAVTATAPVTGLVGVTFFNPIADASVANISAANVSLTCTGCAISLNNPISASNSISLNSASGVTVNALISTGTLTLVGGTGSVSISDTNAGSLTATAAGNVTISDSAAGGSVTLNGSTAGGNLQVTLNGSAESLTVAGPVSGNQVILSADKGGVTQNSGATITGTNSVSLTAGAGSVTFGAATKSTAAGGTVSVTASSSLTDGALATISGDSISLTSTAADVNLTKAGITASTGISLSGATGVNSSGGLLSTTSLVLAGGTGTVHVSDTNATTLSASAKGNVTISDSATGGTVNLNSSSSTTGTLQVTTKGAGESLNVAAPISGAGVTLTASDGGITNTGGAITGTDNVTLTAGNGSVLLSNSAQATAAGSGTVAIVASNSITDAGLSNIGAANISLKSTGSTINLTTAGLSAGTSITLDGSTGVNSTGGLLNTTSLTLAGGSGGVFISKTNATSITASATATIVINDSASGGSGTVTFNGSSSSTGDLLLALSGPAEALKVAGTISATNVNLSAGTGGIQLQADVNCTKNAILSAAGSGAITQSSGTLTGSGSVSLSSGSGDIGSLSTSTPALTASTTGNVIISNSTTGGLSLSSGGSTFNNLTVASNHDLSTANDLAASSGVSLSTANNGSITLGGNVNASTVNLNANGSGSITQSAGTLTGTTSVALSSASGAITLANLATPNITTTQTVGGVGSVNLTDLWELTGNGASTAGTGGFSLTDSNNKGMTITNSIDAGSGPITLTNTGTDSPIVVNGNLTGSTVIITATGAGGISGGGLIKATTSLSLASPTGAINLSNLDTPLITTTQTPGGAGSVTLVDISPLIGNGASTAGTGGFSLSDTAAGGITITNSISSSGALSLVDTKTGSNSSISISGDLSGTAITLTATGSGGILGSGEIKGSSVAMTSPTGAINLSNLNTPDITTTQTTGQGGSVTLVDTSALTGNGASTAGTGGFSLTCGGDINITSSIDASGGTLTLTSSVADSKITVGAAINADNVILTTSGSGSIGGTGTVTGKSSVSLVSPTGAINLNLATPNITTTQTLGGAGSVILVDSDALTGNGVSTAGTGGFSLTDSNAKGITITNAITSGGNLALIDSFAGDSPIFINGALSGSGITLTAAGAGAIIGSASAQISGSTVALTSPTGDINISNLSTPNITTTQGGAGGITLIDTVALTGNGISTAGSGGFSLTDENGISTSNNITSTGAITFGTPTLTTAGGTTISGSAIAVNTTSSSDLSIINAGNLTATTGNVTATSTAGYNLNIGGGGTMNALTGVVNLTAATTDAATCVHFTGSQTFTGNTFITANGPSQSLIVDSGAKVYGNDTLTMLATTRNIQGNLDAKTVIVAAPGIGTIAYSKVQLDLKSIDLTNIRGKTLTLLSGADIVNSGTAKTIDLSMVNGVGGSLTIIAGFTCDGSVFNSKTLQLGTYNNFKAGVGSIKLGNVSINTSSTGANFISGNFMAVATGSVTLGNITTTADAKSGTAGSVTIIGNGISTGVILSGANTSGAVSLSSATPALSGTPAITNGCLTGGTFIAGALATGNIALNKIDSGSATITLATKGAYSQAASTKLTTTGLLSVTGGSKDFTLNTAAAIMALTTSGSATITNSATGGILNASTIGNNLSVTATAGLKVSGAITTGGNLTLANTGAASSLIFSDGVVIKAGSLNASGGSKIVPPYTNLVTADVAKAGSVTLSSSGIIGSDGIRIGNNVQMTSNGAGITVTATKTGANITVGDNLALAANGGTITFADSVGAVNLGTASSTSLKLTAISLNGAAGNLAITGLKGISLRGSGVQVNTLGALTLNSTSGSVALGSGTYKIGNTSAITGSTGLTLANNVYFNSNKAITVTAASVTLGNSDSITAGVLANAGSYPNPSDQIKVADLKSTGGIAMTISGAGGLTGGTGDSIVAEGAALTITASAGGSKISLDDGFLVRADGAALTLSAAAGSVSLGAAGGGGTLNTRAVVGTTGSKTGGLVTVKAATGLTLGANTINYMYGGFSANLTAPTTGAVNPIDIGKGAQISVIGTASVVQAGANSYLVIENKASLLSTGAMTISAAGKSAGGQTAVIGNVDIETTNNIGGVTGTGGAMVITSSGTGTVKVADNSTIKTVGGALTLTAAGAATLGTSTGITMTAGTGTMAVSAPALSMVGKYTASAGALNLTASLATGTGLAIGANSTFTGNALSTWNAAGFTAGTGTAITINKGAFTLNQTSATNLFDFQGTSIAVTGGSLTAACQGTSVKFESGSTVSASTSVAITSSKGAVSLTGTSITGGTTVAVTGANGLTVGDGMQIAANGGTMTLNNNLFGTGVASTMTIGKGAHLTASTGVTLADASTASDMQIKDGAVITANNGAVTISAAGYNSATGVAMNMGDSVAITAKGASGSITAKTTGVSGSFTIGDKYNFSANTSLAITSASTAKNAMAIGVIGGDATSSMTANTTLAVSNPGNITLGAGSIATKAGTTVTLGSTAGSMDVEGTSISANTAAAINGKTNVTILNKASVNSLTTASVTGTAVTVAGSSISANTTAVLTGTNTVALASSASVSGLTGVTVSTSAVTGSQTITIGSGVNLTAGTAVGGTGTISSIATPTGSLVLSSAIVNVTGDGNTFMSNGKDLKVTASGTSTATPLAISGTSNTFQANGGNVQLLSKGLLDAGTGNTFYARSVGATATTSTGGGIELGSGLTTSTAIAAAFGKMAGVYPDKASFGTAVNFNNATGVMQANLTSPGVVQLNGSTLAGDRGVQVFDAATGTAAVYATNCTFKTEALKPTGSMSLVAPGEETLTALGVAINHAGSITHVAVGDAPVELHVMSTDDGASMLVPAQEMLVSTGKDRVQIYAKPGARLSHSEDGSLYLSKGEVFLNASNNLPIETAQVKVEATRGALAAVQVANGCTYVRVCSATGSVSVVVDGRTIELNSGEEILVSNHAPDELDIHPTDGLGRRNTRSLASDKHHVTISEFSIISMITNHEVLCSLHNARGGAEKRLLGRLLKTAASVDTVLKYRGNYLQNAH